MLTEDDVFEVVFDPGSDKREKWIPGPVFSCREDTGGVRLAKTRRESSTQLFQSIGGMALGQTFCMTGVPFAEGLWRRYADVRERDDAVRLGQVGHGEDVFAAAKAKNGSAD